MPIPPYTSINPAAPTELGSPAQVNLAGITFDDDNVFAANATTNSIWDDYVLHGRYERDKHIYMMGVTSPNGFNGASVAFAQLAAPTILWIVDWTAARSNEKPSLPDNTPYSNNWILLDEMIETDEITVAADGTTPEYRISGTYVYGCINPTPQLISSVSFGRPPWLQPVFNQSVPTSLLEKGLIDSPSSTITPPSGGLTGGVAIVP